MRVRSFLLVDVWLAGSSAGVWTNANGVREPLAELVLA